MELEERLIPLAGARNFRDFGGYDTADGRVVKRRVLFRSDGLWRLSDDDLVAVAPLGIRAICDLRRARELEMMPTRWCDDGATIIQHLPLLAENTPSSLDKVRGAATLRSDAEAARQIMKDVYRSMVTEPFSLAQLRKLLVLAGTEQQVPVLVHCSGGKDRTGVSCALILSLLGVAMEDIVSDYMHSQVLYSDRVNLKRAAIQVFDHAEEGEWSLEAVKPVYDVHPDYLASAFDYIIDSYGDVEQFALRGLELGDSELAALRHNLIEPAS